MSNTFKTNTYNQEAPDSGANSESTTGDKNASGQEKMRAFPGSPVKDKSRDQSRDSKNQNQKSEFDDFSHKIEDLGENLKSRGQQISNQISSGVRNNPWAYVGGVSIAALAIGYLLGRRRSA